MRSTLWSTVSPWAEAKEDTRDGRVCAFFSSHQYCRFPFVVCFRTGLTASGRCTIITWPTKEHTHTHKSTHTHTHTRKTQEQEEEDRKETHVRLPPFHHLPSLASSLSPSLCLSFWHAPCSANAPPHLGRCFRSTASRMRSRRRLPPPNERALLDLVLHFSLRCRRKTAQPRASRGALPRVAIVTWGVRRWAFFSMSQLTVCRLSTAARQGYSLTGPSEQKLYHDIGRGGKQVQITAVNTSSVNT